VAVHVDEARRQYEPRAVDANFGLQLAAIADAGDDVFGERHVRDESGLAGPVDDEAARKYYVEHGDYVGCRGNGGLLAALGV